MNISEEEFVGEREASAFGGSYTRTVSESNSWIEACRLLSELSVNSLRIWRRAAGQRIRAAVKMSLQVPLSSVKLSYIPAKKINKSPQVHSTTQQQKKGTADQSTTSGIIARSGAFFGSMGSDWFKNPYSYILN